jgi:acetyl-CoA synthetase
MPMVSEAIVAMLASARLGRMHSVVFAGFSASALRAHRERLGQAASPPPTASTAAVRGIAESRCGRGDRGLGRRIPVEHVLVLCHNGIDVP